VTVVCDGLRLCEVDPVVARRALWCMPRLDVGHHELSIVVMAQALSGLQLVCEPLSK